MMGAQSDEVQLKSRVARKHFGILIEYPFDANRHSLDHKYTHCLFVIEKSLIIGRFWCAREQDHRACQIDWFVEKVILQLLIAFLMLIIPGASYRSERASKNQFFVAHESQRRLSRDSYN